MVFASGTAVLGALCFGVAVLLPVGLPAVALAAAGSVAAASGLLTLLILAFSRAMGRGQHAQPQKPSAGAERPPVVTADTAATDAAAREPSPSIVDEPTQPIVIDLTDDGWVTSANR